MKRISGKRLLSALLTAVFGFGLMPVLGSAASGTVYGPEETVAVPGKENQDREKNFNGGWKFYLGTSSAAQNTNFDDSSWKSVSLPHDFSIIQNFTTSGEAESGFLPGGTGWYRKKFTLPESCAGKTIVLNFDGVYADTTVYVNGAQLGEHHYGYTPFAFDITDYVNCDGSENVIAVKAVNNIPSSRWYSGSGIYRDVTLIITDPVHVDRYGTQVTTPDIAAGTGTVNVKTDVRNDSDAAVTATVASTVYTMGGTAASSAVSVSVTVPAGSMVTAEHKPVVSAPKLWSVDSPEMYYVRTEISVDGKTVDTYDTPFGFRYFSFDSTGFHLNGQNVKLNGVCMHHDQGALGAAAYYDAMYRQLSVMKDMGVNAIRTSHNPTDEHFIDICNELGLLVIEEAFDGWNVAKNGNSNDFARYFNTKLTSGNHVLGGSAAMSWAQFAIESMVRRDRNDPCIIAWSLGNEIQEGGSTSTQFPTIASNLVSWVKALDSRPTTLGDNTRGGNTTLVSVLNTITKNGGVAGFNYASGAELGSLSSQYGVIIASETASATNSRGQYRNQYNNSNSDGKNHLTSYDASAVSWGVTAHESIYNTYRNDRVAGEFVWTGFDYLGEPTPWNGTASGTVSGGSGATPNSSYFGIVETTGFEKDTYYLYRSQWNKNATTLHLVTAWDSSNMLTSAGKTPVWVYSNAPVVKLYRDGVHIATATRQENRSAAGHIYYTYTTGSENAGICTAVAGSGSSALYAVFHVTYAAGTLSARAFEADGTTELPLTGNCGRHTVTTPGIASKLAVSGNRTELAADGASLAYITVDVTDAEGNLLTTAGNAITFSLTGNGEILGVDNGDQATTAKYQQSNVLTGGTSAKINAYAGKALVIVRSTKEGGSFTLTASASGLSGGSITVTTTPVEDGTVSEGLVSFTLVRNYTVLVGTAPEMKTEAQGLMADGSQVIGTISWEKPAIAQLETIGDYSLRGKVTFPGLEPIPVTSTLHVVGDVVVLRNISGVTARNTAPELPAVVSGILADGTLSGEYAVTWETLPGERFARVGDIVTINGTAAVFGGKRLPVTCTIRVAETVNTDSVNVAPAASKLTQDIEAAYQSDNLASIRNGITKPGDNTGERWSNWGNRYRSDQAALTFQWDTAQLISGVTLYYYFDGTSAKPENVEFLVSGNGSDFETVDAAEALNEAYAYGAAYTYTFDKPVNPVALRIRLTQQGGITGTNCVALTECEIMTFAGILEANASAELTALSSDQEEAALRSGVTAYELAGTALANAASDWNAGITVLPVQDNMVHIWTVSEDGAKALHYRVALAGIRLTAPTLLAEMPVAEENGFLVFTAYFQDYAHVENYYQVLEHGFVYRETEKLRGELTVNTPGRTRVRFSDFREDGAFLYHKLPATPDTEYTVRAFMTYKNQYGVIVYIYSDPITVSYNGLT